MITSSDFDDDIFKYMESDTIELKESIGINSICFEKYKETICAFLNAKGGQLIFGVKNDLTNVGIRISNDDLDKFICKIDHIISSGFIICSDISTIDLTLNKIPPNSIKTEIIKNLKNKRFLIINVETTPNKKYQLSDGTIYHRLSASNYKEKYERIYKQSEYDQAQRNIERRVQKINDNNLQLFKKTLKEKSEHETKLQLELKKINNQNLNLQSQLKEQNDIIKDYEDYLIKPLIKVNLQQNETTYLNYFSKLFCLF